MLEVAPTAEKQTIIFGNEAHVVFKITVVHLQFCSSLSSSYLISSSLGLFVVNHWSVMLYQWQLVSNSGRLTVLGNRHIESSILRRKVVHYLTLQSLCYLSFPFRLFSLFLDLFTSLLRNNLKPKLANWPSSASADWRVWSGDKIVSTFEGEVHSVLHYIILTHSSSGSLSSSMETVKARHGYFMHEENVLRSACSSFLNPGRTTECWKSSRELCSVV